MKRLAFEYKVYGSLELTREEHQLLTEASRVHYDFTCKNLSQVGGFLYGWETRFLNPPWEEETISVKADLRELNLLLKILEMPPVDRSQEEKVRKIEAEIRAIFFEVRAEAERLNGNQ